MGAWRERFETISYEGRPWSPELRIETSATPAELAALAADGDRPLLAHLAPTLGEQVVHLPSEGE